MADKCTGVEAEKRENECDGEFFPQVLLDDKPEHTSEDEVYSLQCDRELFPQVLLDDKPEHTSEDEGIKCCMIYCAGASGSSCISGMFPAQIENLRTLSINNKGENKAVYLDTRTMQISYKRNISNKPMKNLYGFWTVIRKADNVVEIKNAVAYDFALDFKKRRLREVYKIYLKNPSLMESQLIFYEAKSEHGPWAFYIKGNRKKCYLTAGPGETIIAKPRRGGEEIYVWIMDPQTYRMVITDT